MAGHSKWKNIQHRKGQQDKQKAKIFNKFSRDITNAARGNPNLDSNVFLQNLIKVAKNAGVSKEIIDRAIIKAKGGDQDGEEIEFEFFGPSNSSFILRCISENRAKTLGHVKSIVQKYGGNLGNTKFLFKEIGFLETSDNLDRVLEEADLIDEFEEEGDIFNIFCKIEHLHHLATKLSGVKSFSKIWMPLETIKIEDKTTIIKMMDMLEDEISSVEEIFCNFE